MNNAENIEYKYALVLVSVINLGTRTFSYLIPENMKNQIKIGQAVLVPFGRQGLINAYVVGFTNYLPEGIKAKQINKIIDNEPFFDINYLKLLEWVADYYFTDIQNVMQIAIPEKFFDKSSKKEAYIKFMNFDNVKERQKEILNILKEYDEIKLSEFVKIAKTTRTTIKKLIDNNNILYTEKEIYRNPLNILQIEQESSNVTLSSEQQNVYDNIKHKIKEGCKSPILLHGITASGKTEIYFKLIDDTVKAGKNVLFLAPEIALISQLTYRLKKRFFDKEVAIWHSSISEGERYDVWSKLRNNEIQILAGARSAVFAPLKNIGLIIIDEEHESTYKQSNPAPRYDAKLVCEKLAELNNASLILGSATPDINSYYKAKQNNTLFTLNKRYNDAKLAKVAVIDMKQEYYKNNHSYFSKSLIMEIKNCLENGNQIMLLLNRRGFSTITQCMECNYIIECDNCAIPMIYHSSDNTLRCHYCNAQKPFTATCPNCGSNLIKNAGLGTQRLEIMTKKLFPLARVARLDSDVMNKKNEHLRILEAFNNGEIDILIGTQMIAKGLDNKNVTLVAAISADGSFNLPDYRASERGFQLLTQLAGRSGRGENEGKVFFQTTNPEYFALEDARKQDYISFYNSEITKRAEFDYPPFSSIIRIITSSKDNFKAERFSQELVHVLKEYFEQQENEEQFVILGSTPCIIERLQEHYRYNILIKNKLSNEGHFMITSFLKKVKIPKDVKMIVDVDPLDIL